MKIRKNDNVMVINGKDRGKTGIVEQIFPLEKKAVVAGVAIYKKSVKPTKKAAKGGIIEINAKIDISNLAIVCPSCNKATRVKYKISNDKKIRICKKCAGSLEIQEK